MDISGIGSFLQTARKNKHLTQGAVAEQLGISAQAVSKWERGENLPDVAFFPDIAKIYGVDVNEILAAGQVLTKRNSFEEDLKKIQERLDVVIAAMFNEEDYEDTLDNILPYTNGGQKLEIMKIILKRRDFEVLEVLIPYLNKKTKTELLTYLLDESEYDAIENIIPAFTRKQREMIIFHFLQNPPDTDVIENFLPFFDKRQMEKIIELTEDEK